MIFDVFDHFVDSTRCNVKAFLETALLLLNIFDKTVRILIYFILHFDMYVTAGIILNKLQQIKQYTFTC